MKLHKESETRRSPEAARRAGPQLARWAATAIRAEQVYAANPADPRVADAARTAASWWTAVGTGGRPADALAYRSRANAALPPAGKAPAPDPAFALGAALDRYARAALPEPGTKVDDKDATDRKGEFEMTASALPPPAAAKIVWTWLFERFPENAQPRTKDIVFAADALKIALKNGSELYVEAVALRRITALDGPPFERPEDRATLMKFLRLEAASCSALRRGSVGFEWVAPFLAAADDAKLLVEQALFRATSRAEVAAADRAIDAATAKFVDVEDRLATQTMAREAVEDAMRALAGTALSQADFDWPISIEKDAATFKDWTDLAARAKLLADDLYRKPPAAWETASLKRAARDVAELARKIANETDAAAAKRFVEAATSARPADLRRYRAALLTTLLAGADRGKVWDAAESIAERQHLATRKDADLLDNEARTVTKPPTLPAPLPDGRARRAEVGVRLLELGGHPSGAALRAKLDELRRAESPEKWRAFAVELRLAWNRTAFVKLLAETPVPDPDRLDRLARAVPPGLWQDAPDKPGVGDWRDAPARRRNRDEVAWRAWLAAHYRKYATARTDVPSAAERYQKAAQDADRKPRD